MPSRCERKTGLDVYCREMRGGIEIGNAIVLCVKCRPIESVIGSANGILPHFGSDASRQALIDADYRCQCTSESGCHPVHAEARISGRGE